MQLTLLRGPRAKTEWTVGHPFKQHEVCGYNGILYVSLQGQNVGHQPDISPTWWTLHPVTAHTHPIDDVVSLQGDLDNKSATAHRHQGETLPNVVLTQPIITGHREAARIQVYPDINGALTLDFNVLLHTALLLDVSISPVTSVVLLNVPVGRFEWEIKVVGNGAITLGAPFINDDAVGPLDNSAGFCIMTCMTDDQGVTVPYTWLRFV